jgi:hypothetical protein
MGSHLAAVAAKSASAAISVVSGAEISRPASDDRASMGLGRSGSTYPVGRFSGDCGAEKGGQYMGRPSRLTEAQKAETRRRRAHGATLAELARS